MTMPPPTFGRLAQVVDARVAHEFTQGTARLRRSRCPLEGRSAVLPETPLLASRHSVGHAGCNEWRSEMAEGIGRSGLLWSRPKAARPGGNMLVMLHGATSSERDPFDRLVPRLPEDLIVFLCTRPSRRRRRLLMGVAREARECHHRQ